VLDNSSNVASSEACPALAHEAVVDYLDGRVLDIVPAPTAPSAC
jgi:hypothetical protein